MNALFGFFRWKKAVNRGLQYCTTMIAGLDQIHGRSIPNQIFSDGYVMGFFQELIMHAIYETVNGRDPGPRFMVSVPTAIFDRLIPGYGERMMEAFAFANQPAHPGHTSYMVGRREGSEYVNALRTDDAATAEERMLGFREFVARNYLGKSN